MWLGSFGSHQMRSSTSRGLLPHSGKDRVSETTWGKWQGVGGCVNSRDGAGPPGQVGRNGRAACECLLGMISRLLMKKTVWSFHERVGTIGIGGPCEVATRAVAVLLRPVSAFGLEFLDELSVEVCGAESWRCRTRHQIGCVLLPLGQPVEAKLVVLRDPHLISSHVRPRRSLLVVLAHRFHKAKLVCPPALEAIETRAPERVQQVDHLLLRGQRRPVVYKACCIRRLRQMTAILLAALLAYDHARRPVLLLSSSTGREDGSGHHLDLVPTPEIERCVLPKSGDRDRLYRGVQQQQQLLRRHSDSRERPMRDAHFSLLKSILLTLTEMK